MFIKPATGLVIHDPVKKDILPIEGREVAESTYWRRRLRDGDVVLSEKTTTKPKKGSDA